MATKATRRKKPAKKPAPRRKSSSSNNDLQQISRAIFRPEVGGVLRAQLPEASAAEIEALVRAANGSPGKALGFAGLDLATLDGEMAAIAARGDADNAIRSRLARTLGAKAAQPRYEAFLARVPAFIAREARGRHGRALADALDAYDSASQLGPLALAQSLDAQATVFELGGILARLAR